MEFICINKECSHIFHPHTFFAIRHPNRAKCPKCSFKAVKTEKGEEEWKLYNLSKNQSEFGKSKF